MKQLILGIAFSTFANPALVLAENIKIPIGTQTPESKQLVRPATGMTKTKVKIQFGSPAKENAPKGNPPISTWEYEKFTVYFENDHVIYSVIKPTFA